MFPGQNAYYDLGRGNRVLAALLQPGPHSVTRNTECSLNRAQTVTTLKQLQNLFLPVRRIFHDLRILSTLLSAGKTTVFLLTVRCSAIHYEIVTSTVTTGKSLDTHVVCRFSWRRNCTTPFSVSPQCSMPALTHTPRSMANPRERGKRGQWVHGKWRTGGILVVRRWPVSCFLK